MAKPNRLKLTGLLIVGVIAGFGTGCADDTSRIERARQHQAKSEYRAATIELKNVLQDSPENTEARALLGQIALLNGDSVIAIKELRRARDLGASPDQYAVDLGRALLRERRYLEVVSLNPDLLTDNKQQAALLALMGTAKLEQDDQTGAEDNFAAALKLAPDQPDALIGKARLALAQGNVDEAESSLNRMLNSKPDDHKGLATLARLQLSKGDHAEAEQNFAKASKAIEGTRLAQERLMYQAGMLDAQLGQGKITEAQALGADLIKMTSEHPLALLQAARADFAAKNYDDAIDKAQRIVTSLPSAGPPRMLIAAAAIAKGNTTLAATHLQSAVNINPGNEIARKLLAQVRMQLGDPNEALELLRPLMAAGTNDAQLLAMAGTATIRSGDTGAGVALVERGMEIDSSDPAMALQAAATFLTAGELDRAIAVLESLPQTERISYRELLLILALIKKGDTEGARAQAQAIVDANPETAASHRLMGEFHIAIGELDQARVSFEQAMQKDPNDSSALLNLARLDVNQGNVTQAGERLRELLKRSPGNLVALTALAELEEKRGALEEGVELLEQARAANPQSIAPVLTLGRYYLRARQLGLAEERADQAVRIAPDIGQSHALLGMVKIAGNRHFEAIDHLERAIELSPQTGSSYYHLARAQMASGREDAGYQSLKRAVELSPRELPAHAALVAAAAKRGDFKAALAAADALIEQFPDLPGPLILKGDVHVARKDYNGALDLYAQAATIEPSRKLAAKRFEVKLRQGVADPWLDLEQWVTANPDDTAGRSMLARAYLTAGMNDQAIKSFEQVMALAPEAGVAATLAVAHREAGDLDTAVAWLEKSIDLDPEEMSTRAALASVELQRGNVDQSLKIVRNLRGDYPNETALYALEGEVLLATENYAGSIAAFDRAAEAHPSQQIAIKQHLARKKAGQDDAWRVLQNWVDDHPTDIGAAIVLAQEYTTRDWHDAAVTTYRGVLNSDPDNLIALNNIAWVYYSRSHEGDLDRAVNAASKAYEQRPEIPAIADTYGWFLLKTGQGSKALPILRAAAAGDNADREIRYHLAATLEDQDRDAEAATVLDEILTDPADFDSRKDAEDLRRRLSP